MPPLKYAARLLCVQVHFMTSDHDASIWCQRSDHQSCALPFRIRSTGRGANAVVLCHHWGWGRLSVSPVEHRLAHGIHCHSAISAPGCHHLWRLCRCWLTHAGEAPSYLLLCCLPAVCITTGLSLSICQCVPTAQQNWIMASSKATQWFLRACVIR